MEFITTYLLIMILTAIIISLLILKYYNGDSQQKIAVILGLFILAAFAFYFMINGMFTHDFMNIIGYTVVGFIAAAILYYRNQKSIN